MEEKEILIKVEGLSKKFSKDLKTSLKYGVQDLFSNFGRNDKPAILRKNEFWAVKDINFELRRGECLGLIGHNGAGKSTLLKILNGLINPDEGKVTIKGKVGALIELGAGFNPILSGRENIYNNGAILGFTRKEINNKLEEIIDFAEIREFIDMPVQNYSSGMKVRLGFAIAAQMEPDVLIIDEVLAVGDVSFRAKCYERIAELMSTCCVILVSHSMPQISRVSTKAILLNKGKVQIIGTVGNVIETYYGNVSNSKLSEINVIYSKYCKLNHFYISSENVNNFTKIFTIEIFIESTKDINNAELDLVLMSRELQPVCNWNSRILNKEIILNKGQNHFTLQLENLNLNTGIYSFALTLDDIFHKEKYLWLYNIKQLKVRGDHTGITPILISGECFKNSIN